MGIRPDTPLGDLTGDEYGFGVVAEHVARSISQCNAETGLGIGIEGEWGSGKTTFANQIVMYLRLQSPTPLVTRYNAWAAVDETEAAMGLLVELSRTLRETADKTNPPRGAKKKLKNGVDDMMHFFEQHGIDQLHHLVKPGKNILRHFMGIGSMEQLKTGIAEVLNVLGLRFYVFVDDLDRMASQHLRVLFATIKTVCDVSDLVFILALDKKVVANALSQVQGGDGVAYLDKIISLAIPVPYIEPDDLLRTFLTRVVYGLKIDPRIVKSPRWKRIEDLSVRRFLRKPRDVIRLENAITLTYPNVAADVLFEDFVALEALRLFEPAVHSRIKELMPTVLGRPTKATRTEVDSVLGLASIQTREALGATLSELFPLCGFGKSDISFETVSPKGVAASGKFPVYFQFGLIPGTLTEAEFSKITQAAFTSPEACRDYFLQAGSMPLRGRESLIEMVLDRLITSEPREWYRDQQNDVLIGLSMIEDRKFEIWQRRRGPHASGSMLTRVSEYARRTLNPDSPPATDELVNALRNKGQSLLVLLQLIDGYTTVANDIDHRHTDDAKKARADLEALFVPWIERLALSGALFELDYVPELIRVWLSSSSRDSICGTLAKLSLSRPQAQTTIEAFFAETSQDDVAANGTALHAYRAREELNKYFPDNYFDVLLTHADDDSIWVRLFRSSRSDEKVVQPKKKPISI
jgi:hypothetical protein